MGQYIWDQAYMSLDCDAGHEWPTILYLLLCIGGYLLSVDQPALSSAGRLSPAVGESFPKLVHSSETTSGALVGVSFQG